MDIGTILLCAAVIAAGVGVIMYVLLRTPKNSARIGDRPSITLGDEPQAGAAQDGAEDEGAPAETMPLQGTEEEAPATQETNEN